MKAFLQQLQIAMGNHWLAFGFCLVIVVLTSWLMRRQAAHFRYLRGTAVTPFSIIDLELPGSPATIAHIMTGISALPHPDGVQTRRALKHNLLTDFFFMLGIYPAIFILCLHTALQMHTAGFWLMAMLAFAQLPALLFDILENIHLLRQLQRPLMMGEGQHRWYKRMVLAKWAIAILGLVCAMSCLLYYWLTGRYSNVFLYVGLVSLAIVGLLMVYTLYRAIRAVLYNKAEEAPRPDATPA